MPRRKEGPKSKMAIQKTVRKLDESRGKSRKRQDPLLHLIPTYPAYLFKAFLPFSPESLSFLFTSFLFQYLKFATPHPSLSCNPSYLFVV